MNAASNPTVSPSPLTTPEALSAKVDRCITRTELAITASERAADQSVKNGQMIAEMHGTLKRFAADHTSLRHGIPASWPGRLIMIGVAAAVGAITASGSMLACSHRERLATERAADRVEHAR